MRFVLRSILEINEREASFSRRGFTYTRPEVRERLEHVGRIFLHGYHAALNTRDQERLVKELNDTQLEQRGFAYEGAGMALALLDGLTLWGRRLQKFMEGAGNEHIYMVHVGAGWACARLPWLRTGIEKFVRRLDPVLGWLVLDGYGFHEGYFHGQTALASGNSCSHLSGAARHVFYQGLGRSLWFMQGADPLKIAQAISRLAPQFRGDAWSGIGLACAYAGGAGVSELEEIKRRSAFYSADLGQGAAFAAKARQRAGNESPHTEAACKVLCGMSAIRAAALCDESLREVRAFQSCPYQQWRQFIQEKLLFFQEMSMRGECYESPRLASSKPN